MGPAPGTTPNRTPEGSGPPAGGADAVVDASNRFALDLYSHLRGDPSHGEGNLFFSPFSLSSALAITYEGARGTTAGEIRSVFHFPADDATRRGGFQEISRGINQRSTRYVLSTANALWAEKTYAFLPGYINTAREYYGANATNMDFVNQPEPSRQTINRWVEDQTNNRIRDLIPPGVINELTRLVITNAVYFKGTWVKQFDVNQTSDEIFTLASGETVPVRMMARTDEDAIFNYTETDSVQVLRMPYASDGGKQLSMLVILPKGNHLATVEDTLTLQQLEEWRNALAGQRVRVFVPRFTMETKYSLPDTLAAMGMPTAFTLQADLSGMDGTKNLYIRDVIHQAFVEVNEEGTEAAAATAVVIALKAVQHEEPVPEFRADHPFIIVIQDDDTGTLLVLGRVMNPAG
ncbi:MAG: serpin family protein [Methanomicrobiales archaeon]|nr:serpin family protein [Methanomicrobiales archaeon]